MGKFFRKNRFGIEEPIFSPLLGAHRMDVILMPLVGFDKHKNRLGMGGGFYDKTLSFHRGYGMNLIDHTPALKSFFQRQALGKIKKN